VALESWEAGGDGGVARVGPSQPKESRSGFKKNPSMNKGRSGLHCGGTASGQTGKEACNPR
jgi:hypothetical protein